MLGYEYLPLSGFHHTYGLYDETGTHRLTEDIEIHFLELPKVTRQDIRKMRTLDKWMAFISNKLSDEEMEAIAMSEAAISTAWDRIEAFMRDAGQRRKYEQREKFEHDYVSDMEGGTSSGRRARNKARNQSGTTAGHHAYSNEYAACRNTAIDSGADGGTS